ncbi:hypothetical protein EBZ35_01600, partial [bacterium]|nr:hypothetical protein [bacterium]
LPALGAGFKNFRPIRMDKGRIILAKNSQIPDYSTEQYHGNVDPDPKGDWRKARFAYDGMEMGFYEYARTSMAGGKLSFNPVAELKATMKTQRHPSTPMPWYPIGWGIYHAYEKN